MDPLDMVVVNMALAHPDDAFELEQLIRRTFSGCASMDVTSFKGGVGSWVWYRMCKKRGKTLAVGKELVHRSYKGRSFVWSLPLAVAWPPPVSSGPEDGCSFLWYCELDLALSESSQLDVLVKQVGEGYSGYALRAVRPTLLLFFFPF